MVHILFVFIVLHLNLVLCHKLKCFIKSVVCADSHVPIKQVEMNNVHITDISVLSSCDTV